MTADSRSLPLDQRQVELAVLVEVIELHPDHLTPAELVLKISGERDESEDLVNSIRELIDCGLFRSVGDVLAPTQAALLPTPMLTPCPSRTYKRGTSV